MLTNNNFVVSCLLCVSGLILREWTAGFSQPVQSGSSEAGAGGQQLRGLPRIHTGAQSGPEQERPQVHWCTISYMNKEIRFLWLTDDFCILGSQGNIHNYLSKKSNLCICAYNYKTLHLFLHLCVRSIYTQTFNSNSLQLVLFLKKTGFFFFIIQAYLVW